MTKSERGTRKDILQVRIERNRQIERTNERKLQKKHPIKYMDGT